MAQIFSLKNSKFFSGLKKICARVPPITTAVRLVKFKSKHFDLVARCPNQLKNKNSFGNNRLITLQVAAFLC